MTHARLGLRSLSFGFFVAATVAAGSVQTSVPSCIQYAGEARYRGVGYQHVVHIVNGCERAAACDVSTDVNPEAQHVDVPARTHVEVVTFLGSPAREFTPVVDCKLE